MKYLMILMGVVCLASACAPPPEPEPEASPEPVFDETAEEAAVRDLVEQELAAYNEHDAAAVANSWREDGEMIANDGSVIRGRAAIRGQYEEIFETNPDANTTASVDSVRFVKPNVAIALTRGTVNGLAGESPTWNYLWTAVLVKQNGNWELALSQFMGDETD